MIHLCQNILDRHFNVLGTFNLNRYSRNMSKLFKDLESIKKERFDHRDRIVFTLFDHDFYLDNAGPGWTLYNLQLILAELDISNFFCLLLTNQPDYNDYTRLVQTQLTTDDYPIRSITTLLNYDFMPGNVTPRDNLIDQIEKPYCVLSRQSRPHRTFFISKLMHEKLTDFGLVGYNNILFSPAASDNNLEFRQQSFGFSLLDIPQSWQRLLLKRQANRDIVRDFQQQYPQYKNFTEPVDLLDKDQSCSLDNHTPISRGLLYIGIETEVQLPKVFASRISLRGIIERRPFVLFACPGSLKFIQDRGFQTFKNFWDEDYDSIVDVEQRVDCIIDIIKYVSTMNVSDLKSLYLKMKPTVDYNHDFYHNNFVPHEEAHLEKEILLNLSGN